VSVGTSCKDATVVTYETLQLPLASSRFRVHWTHTLALAFLSKAGLPPCVVLISSDGDRVTPSLSYEAEEDLWSWSPSPDSAGVPTALIEVTGRGAADGELVLCGAIGTEPVFNAARAVAVSPVALCGKGLPKKGSASFDGISWKSTRTDGRGPTTLELSSMVRARVSQALAAAVRSGVIGSYDQRTDTCALSFGAAPVSPIPYSLSRA